MSKHTKDSIVKSYIDIYNKYKECKWTHLQKEGLFRTAVLHHFESLEDLDKLAREKYPSKFTSVLIQTLINKESKNKLNKIIKSTKRFVITTAVANDEPNIDALASIKRYCKKNKAELLLLVCAGHNIGLKKGYGEISKLLAKENIVIEDLKLNDNFSISTLKTTAQQTDPTTGLIRIGSREGTFVYASPKQRLRVEPTGNTTNPRCIMTTGAITRPNYKSDAYMSKKASFIADLDHKMGALIVEIVDNHKYHFRQVQFDKDGSFVDLGVMYKKDKIIPYKPQAIVLGDWHTGDTDPVVERVTFDIIKELKPTEVILHDGFNGKSINHHEDRNLLLKAMRSSKFELNLKDEITEFAKSLNKFSKVVNKVIVVESNHNEFLSRYLSECRFKDDPHNLKISLELALAMLNGKNPLKHGCEQLGMVNSNKIQFLYRDEDYIIGDIQCGAHGDKGANGARGSLKSSELAYGKCVVGHSHTPGILRDAWSVGTSTYLKLDYTKGPSSWLNTHCLVYPNGMRQLINIIDGKYKLK